MDDLISRQAAIDALIKCGDYYDEDDEARRGVAQCIGTIYDLPSAQPDVPDTNVGDMISRQAAIESVADEIHMIGYLSGPVTGNPDYKRQFAWAAKQLTRMGYDVINPAALSQVVPIEELSYDTIMEIDMFLLSKADYLIQLPGWEGSIGCNRELGYALATDKIVVSLEHLLEGREVSHQ